MDFNGRPMEVYGAVCRVCHQGEQGHGALSVEKSVGKHPCLVAGNLFISLYILEMGGPCRSCAGVADSLRRVSGKGKDDRTSQAWPTW